MAPNIEARYFDYAVRTLAEGRFPWLVKTGIKFATVPLGKKLGRVLSGPIIGGLMLNYRCNLKCVYCSYWKITSAEGEMTTDQAMDIVDQFKEIGTSGIGLMGGEPLLRKDAYQVIRKIHDLGMTSSTTTNGYALNETNVGKLLDSGIDFIAVSLDSPVKEINDKQRGHEGAHDMAVKALGNLLRHREANGNRVGIILNSVITGYNYAEIPKLIDLAKDIGVDHVYFLGVDLAPASSSVDEIAFENANESKFKEVIDFLIEEKGRSKLINTSVRQLRLMRDFQFSNKPFEYDCLAGYTSLYVDAYSKVFPCNSYLERGRHVDVLGEGRRLRDIWKSQEYQSLRDDLTGCKECYWPCQQELNVMFNKL